ncbi:MAG: 30S ribosomal protein S16 [Candidatus Margulisbacteria bacterium]|nr:30S ribosomal protein S16 [Candidatus Margulisiibacteriota bacterium]
MAVKLKLKRVGTKHKPFYRIVVADERWSGKTGSAIDVIGTYNPKVNPKLINIDKEKAEEWLKKGAIPTEPVSRLLKTLQK